MSRIGKKPIQVPGGVTVDIKEGKLSVKGPKGSLTQEYNTDISVAINGNQIELTRPTEQKRHKALHGLYRALFANMITGVTEGYKLQMELVGVGFKADNKGNLLELNLGYSHSIFFMVPEELKVTTINEKGKNPTIILEGIDKQLIGHVAAEIRKLRKVEPYKGKGVRFTGEEIRRKAGKTGAKK
jgi:large subunit ribosomal protein L6